ncbi:putative dolichyl pyrophosphate Man9GlcNAc2 alpha-1,3-glucosyltransferase [Camellia lanceoleosa]|uniref:Dolichyl pyrophosphate Man9GlcNAc2 alpha-1,3-glucosyltransferase n=1 Tax=Camellia lanceoleosa TaxID=1840588 RepID=A0ACC0HYF1_9ERIC|nr:putative dolichyl pyrophosphate Man9GlcNAc2 alpha-1,3-glucosyltransferase [Camellia lanceoleosa]
MKMMTRTTIDAGWFTGVFQPHLFEQVCLCFCTANNLSYWGLDYPPLTAYHNNVHGLFFRNFHPGSASLYTSRGHESYLGGRKSDVAWHIAMILLKPCLILIDHGHFQYNCISLGLVVGAVAPILSNKELLACVLFCLAFNHKQVASCFDKLHTRLRFDLILSSQIHDNYLVFRSNLAQ